MAQYHLHQLLASYTKKKKKPSTNAGDTRSLCAMLFSIPECKEIKAIKSHQVISINRNFFLQNYLERGLVQALLQNFQLTIFIDHSIFI